MADEFGARVRLPVERRAELRAWIAVLTDEIERRGRRPDGPPPLSPAERQALLALLRAA